MSTFIESGLLRQRITLEQDANYGGGPNPTGQLKPNWQASGDYWAEVLSSGGTLATQADQVKGVLNWQVTMRNIGPIAPGINRILYDGHTLTISSVVKVDSQNAYYYIMATEKLKGVNG